MSLPRYVINFDELEAELRKNLLQAIDDAMRNKYPQLDTGDIESLLSEIEDLLPDEKYKGLKNRIEQFLLYKYDGTQQVQGAMIDIPAIMKDYKKDFIFDKDVFLTGLHLNQTGWKKEDRYSLVINKNKIINNATTKEIGEHKYFNTYYKVKANTPVSFILHNLSGNSRQALIDLEYFNLGDLPTAGPTLICFDISSSMGAFLSGVADLLVKYLRNLDGNDPVTICFVAGIDAEYKKGSYDFIKKDFVNKYRAIEFLSTAGNIPYRFGGMYDIVTVQCILDYQLKSFTNYIVATDQYLSTDPDPNFQTSLKKFFKDDQNTFAIPVTQDWIMYWNGIYDQIGLFKPIKG